MPCSSGDGSRDAGYCSANSREKFHGSAAAIQPIIAAMKSLIQRRALRRGDRDIPYEVRRSARARSRITVKVQPDCSVVVTAPRWASLSDIQQVVTGYAAWIEKRLDAYLAAGPPYRPEYRAGARHYFLGDLYPLELVPVGGRRGRIALVQQRLHVQAPSLDPAGIRELLRRWYREQAERCFTERLARLVPRLSWVSGMPCWKLRRMRTQWGSCSSHGDISFNTHLVKAAQPQIDYVLLHELCHLKHLNHGAGFQRLMNTHMPDWRARRRALNDASHRLLLD
jgi:predicted metal-dependent hydrolase